MGEIVNLRRARKRRTAEKAEVAATANRVIFCVAKNAKSKAEAEKTRAQSRLEAHRREMSQDGD
jgi:ElaB/YqjD/DUF883 family membrane-anchored ribosome-binding protein